MDTELVVSLTNHHTNCVESPCAGRSAASAARARPRLLQPLESLVEHPLIVNVRDGALSKALAMKARSPENFMDPCDEEMTEQHVIKAVHNHAGRIWINRVASELVLLPFIQPRICTLSFTSEMSPWNASP